MQENHGPKLPSPTSGILVFVAVLVANVALGIVSNQLGLDEDFLLIATPVLVLFLTGLSILVFRVDPKETFLLRLPSLADLLMAFPLAVSFVILSDQLATLLQEIYSLPPEIQEVWLRMVRAETAGEWVLKITTIGFGAAISEELLFRGFIQNAFLQNMSRTAAILWCSFLFMVLHILPLPTFAAAGVVLGITALSTRSILIPILIHFINNISALALVNLTDLETLGDPLWTPPTILVPATAIFVLTMGFYLRRLALTPAPAAPLRLKESESEPLLLPHQPRRLREELAEVPERKRRLGWLVVVAAVLIGVSVLLGLFVYSLYSTNPRAAHAAIIDALDQEATRQLAPEASERGEDLGAGFDSLLALNESGNLEWPELFRILMAYAEAGADGTIGSTDVDSILGVVNDVVKAAALPRPL
jgi:membrane protease YdiL (CAAX protease family)